MKEVIFGITIAIVMIFVVLTSMSATNDCRALGFGSGYRSFDGALICRRDFIIVK